MTKNSINQEKQSDFNIAFHELYSKGHAERVRRGIQQRAKQGWPSYLPPMGYCVNKSTKTITKDSETWGRIKLLWKEAIYSGKSLSELLEFATNELALRCKNGKPLTREALRRMLSSRFYTGKFWYNGQLYDGKYPAMVSEEEFDKVQQYYAFPPRKIRGNQ